MEAVPKKSSEAKHLPDKHAHKKPTDAKPPARLASESVAGRHVAKKHAPHVAKEPHTAKEHHAKPAHAEVKTEATPAALPLEVEKPVTAKIPHGKSFYAVGRRKTAVSQILLTQGTGQITLNQLPFEGYFQTADLQLIVTQPFRSLGVEKQFNVKGKIHGGGIHAQAESLRHAISRALITHNPESRRTLKKLGFLKRDPRVKERKKPGLKRARRAPQFSKR